VNIDADKEHAIRRGALFYKGGGEQNSPWTLNEERLAALGVQKSELVTWFACIAEGAPLALPEPKSLVPHVERRPVLETHSLQALTEAVEQETTVHVVKKMRTRLPAPPQPQPQPPHVTYAVPPVMLNNILATATAPYAPMMVPLTAMPPDVRMQIMLHMQNVQALHQMQVYPHLSRGTTVGQLFDATISTLSPQDMHDFMTSVMAALQRRMPQTGL
jgi:hypothetical protein